MFKLINIFEIVIEYFKNMRKDLKVLPFIIHLVLIPFIIDVFFCFIITNKNYNKFYDKLIIITSIFILLLLNVFIIVYYSIERIAKNTKKEIKQIKIDFLLHINSTVSMTILISIFILILSLAGNIIDYSIILKIVISMLLGFMITNVFIILLRIFRLIRFEINE